VPSTKKWVIVLCVVITNNYKQLVLISLYARHIRNYCELCRYNSTITIVPISFVMHLSVCLYQLSIHWTDFHEIWYQWLIQNCKNPDLVQRAKKYQALTWRPQRVLYRCQRCTVTVNFVPLSQMVLGCLYNQGGISSWEYFVVQQQYRRELISIATRLCKWTGCVPLCRHF
jgi:hypothetical protein